MNQEVSLSRPVLRPSRYRSAPRVSRRHVLGAGAVALGGLGVASLGVAAGLGRHLALAQETPVGPNGVSRFLEPPVRSSRNGLLETTLEATPAVDDGLGHMVDHALGHMVDLESVVDPDRLVNLGRLVGLGRLVYEGTLTGPTLRLRPGDRLNLTLINHLGDQETNLHVHGLHVSPRDNGDNIFVHVPAGEAFAYEYAIPDNHPSGLFWYHPHHHGNSLVQLKSGLAGAIVIEGGLDDLPGIAGVPERLLVLQGPVIAPVGVRFLVNGQVNPALTIQPGATQRWRILNATANNVFNLALSDHQFHQIATDGNALPEVWTEEIMLLGPGERADVLVQGGPAGAYELQSLAWGEGVQSQPTFLVATLVADGPPQQSAPLPTTLLPSHDLSDTVLPRRRERTLLPSHDLSDADVARRRATSLLPFHDLSGADVARRRVITFQNNKTAPFFVIDGKAFDHHRVDQTVKLGTTEEWAIRNDSEEWHPFHIHVNEFQVMSINGRPVPPHYKDTVMVPPSGEVVIRIPFLDFTGKSVYHCHILLHEDLGMMGVFEVVD